MYLWVELKVKINWKATLLLLLIGLTVLTFRLEIKTAKGEWTGTVYIRADGSIEPTTAPIQRIEDIYKFS